MCAHVPPGQFTDSPTHTLVRATQRQAQIPDTRYQRPDPRLELRLRSGQTLIRSDNHGVPPKGMNCNFLFRGINCRALSLARLAFNVFFSSSFFFYFAFHYCCLVSHTFWKTGCRAIVFCYFLPSALCLCVIFIYLFKTLRFCCYFSIWAPCSLYQSCASASTASRKAWKPFICKPCSLLYQDILWSLGTLPFLFMNSQRNISIYIAIIVENIYKRK